MMTPTELVGLWSADAMYGPGAQSDDVLFFFSGGTGRLDFHNPVLCNAWTFHWNIISDSKLHIVGDVAYEHDNKVITYPWKHDIEHSVTLKTESTPRGDEMRVLRFTPHLISGLSDHFAFCRSDIDEFAQPDFSYMDNLP